MFRNHFVSSALSHSHFLESQNFSYQKNVFLLLYKNLIKSQSRLYWRHTLERRQQKNHFARALAVKSFTSCLWSSGTSTTEGVVLTVREKMFENEYKKKYFCLENAERCGAEQRRTERDSIETRFSQYTQLNYIERVRRKKMVRSGSALIQFGRCATSLSVSIRMYSHFNRRYEFTFDHVCVCIW